MAINNLQLGTPQNYAVSQSQNSGCASNTCSSSVASNNTQCPDHTIKRHDTKPTFKVLIEDCDGPMDLQDENLVLEVNIWFYTKLKAAIDEDDTYFRLVGDIGFDQALVGDIIVMDRTRRPEHMLVTAFDEANKLIQVQRAYSGTTADPWAKGQGMRIFRTMNGPASIESVLEDVTNIDGTTAANQLSESYLIYEWTENDTCLPGCYMLEFKLLKMEEEEEGDGGMSLTAMQCNSSVIPSFTPSWYTPSNFHCGMGTGVEWVRRFPTCGEGFLIMVCDSPTAEM